VRERIFGNVVNKITGIEWPAAFLDKVIVVPFLELFGGDRLGRTGLSCWYAVSDLYLIVSGQDERIERLAKTQKAVTSSVE
jgi:hypothetical protein